MQVDVLADVGPQLVKDQAEPVPARRAAPLEETFGRERGHQPVHGALAEAELAGQFGDAELLAGPGERTQHAGRVAHRRQLGPVRLSLSRLGAGGRHDSFRMLNRNSVPLCGTRSLVSQAGTRTVWTNPETGIAAWGSRGTDRLVRALPACG